MLPPLLIVSNPQLQYLISYDGEQICTVNHNQIQHWFSRNESGIIVLDLDLIGEENWEYKRNNFVQIGVSSSVQLLKNAQKLGADYLLLKEVTLSETLNISIKSAYNSLMLHCRLQHLESKVEELEQQRGLSLLVGGIAHDFNNLLSIITGSARILSQNISLSDTEKELLTNIIESSQHGRSISRQLMHFQQEKEQSCDLSSVLKRISRLLQQTLSSNMKLHVEPPAAEILMRMSAVEVIRIIMNLTLNARDAMPDGGSIYIRSKIDPPFALIEIEDEGIGMPEEVQKRIFEPFYTTKKDKGTGLGLTGVQAIIKRRGGNITCQSTMGQGTSFIIKLPLFHAQQLLIFDAQTERANAVKKLYHGKGLISFVCKDLSELINRISLGDRHLQFLVIADSHIADLSKLPTQIQNHNHVLVCSDRFETHKHFHILRASATAEEIIQVLNKLLKP